MRALKSDKVVAALEAIGLKMESYKRGPLGSGNAALAKTSNGDGIRYWFPENVSIRVSTDKRKGQAVLEVTEKPREIKNKVVVWNAKGIDANGGRKAKMTWQELKKKSPEISIRGRATWSFIPNSVFVPQHCVAELDAWGEAKVTIYGFSKTRKTVTYFLVGVDENKHFISVLRNPVATVSEAHDELRPDGLSDSAVRQGEWFFDPVDAETTATVFCNAKKRLAYSPLEGALSRNPSSHKAKIIDYKGQRYAVGNVNDSRKGYHKTLNLKTLHRVVRNNERELQNVRNYD